MARSFCLIMDTLMRKAWSIVGYTYEGAYYCFACVERKAIDHKPAVQDEPSPVFLSDEHDFTCEKCGRR